MSSANLIYRNLNVCFDICFQLLKTEKKKSNWSKGFFHTTKLFDEMLRTLKPNEFNGNALSNPVANFFFAFLLLFCL